MEKTITLCQIFENIKEKNMQLNVKNTTLENVVDVLEIYGDLETRAVVEASNTRAVGVLIQQGIAYLMMKATFDYGVREDKKPRSYEDYVNEVLKSTDELSKVELKVLLNEPLKKKYEAYLQKFKQGE